MSPNWEKGKELGGSGGCVRVRGVCGGGGLWKRSGFALFLSFCRGSVNPAGRRCEAAVSAPDSERGRRATLKAQRRGGERGS